MAKKIEICKEGGLERAALDKGEESKLFSCPGHLERERNDTAGNRSIQGIRTRCSDPEEIEAESVIVVIYSI